MAINRELNGTLWNQFSSVVGISAIIFLVCVLSPASTKAQDYVTGSLEGMVVNSETGEPIAGATVRIINLDTGVPVALLTDSKGRFYKGLLPPGEYTITISARGFKAKECTQPLRVMRSTIAPCFAPAALE